MSLLSREPPVRVHGAAVYPYSVGLEQRCQRLSRFDEAFSLCLHKGHELWLPRRMVPDGGTDQRSTGQTYVYENNFRPRSLDQQRVAGAIRQRLTSALWDPSFILQAPTGYGKTIMGCFAASVMNRRTLVITTKEDIVEQWRVSAQ